MANCLEKAPERASQYVATTSVPGHGRGLPATSMPPGLAPFRPSASALTAPDST